MSTPVFLLVWANDRDTVVVGDRPCHTVDQLIGTYSLRLYPSVDRSIRLWAQQSKPGYALPFSDTAGRGGVLIRGYSADPPPPPGTPTTLDDRCPRCKEADQLDWGSTETSATEATQTARCLVCGCLWYDTYVAHRRNITN